MSALRKTFARLPAPGGNVKDKGAADKVDYIRHHDSTAVLFFGTTDSPWLLPLGRGGDNITSQAIEPFAHKLGST